MRQISLGRVLSVFEDIFVHSSSIPSDICPCNREVISQFIIFHLTENHWNKYGIFSERYIICLSILNYTKIQERWVIEIHIMTSSNGNIFRVTDHLCGEIPPQRPVTRSFDVFFDLRLNKRLSKQSWGWWFETLSRPLWPHCNDLNRVWYRGRHIPGLLDQHLGSVMPSILYTICSLAPVEWGKDSKSIVLEHII